MARPLSGRYTHTPVYRTRHSHPSPFLTRATRSEVARWLAVLLIAPMLMLWAFNGATFFAHGHNVCGMHLHPVVVLGDDRLGVADHADVHCHDHAALPSEVPENGEQDGKQLAEVPGGIIFSFEVQMQLPTRSVDLEKTLSPATVFAIFAFVLPASPDLDLHDGSPGGTLNSGPMNLLSLRAGDRLVRTSRALLI